MLIRSKGKLENSKGKVREFSVKNLADILYHANINRVSIQPIYKYFEFDNKGIVPPKRCGNCRNCEDCSFRGHMISLKEQYKTQIIESKIH